MGIIAGLLRRLVRRPGHVGDGLSGRDSGTVDLELRIPNMVCEGCAEKIEGVLRTLPGVREVRPNVRQKRIRIRFESSRVNPQQLKNTLATAGFTADGRAEPVGATAPKQA